MSMKGKLMMNNKLRGKKKALKQKRRKILSRKNTRMNGHNHRICFAWANFFACILVFILRTLFLPTHELLWKTYKIQFPSFIVLAIWFARYGFKLMKSSDY